MFKENPPTAQEKQTIRPLLGQMPDIDIAEMIHRGKHKVGVYRRELGIAPCKPHCLTVSRFSIASGEPRKQVLCLKCQKATFWSPLDFKGVPLRRICPSCTEHNQSPGVVYEIGLSVGRIRRRAAL